MTINFENYGRFYCALSYVDNTVVDYRNDNTPHSLAEVMEFVEYHMSRDLRIILGSVWDWDTGECVATIERENDDFIDDEEDYETPFDEVGYDPYLGCYTDDC